MVKKGGTKKKIEIKKIENKSSRATSFTKRCHGLYSKASQLCLLTDAQIAILATPSSSQSNVSFYSFGHSSVDTLVSAYLAGESLPPPVRGESKEMRESLDICLERKKLGLGFWWDEDRLKRSENLEEIEDALESMKRLLNNVNRLATEEKIDKLNKKSEANDLLQPDAGNLVDWTDMDIDELLYDETEEEDQVVEISENVCNNNNDLLQPAAAGNLVDWTDKDIDQLFYEETEETDQVVEISENLSNNNKDLLQPAAAGNLDDLDFQTIFEGLPLDELARSFLVDY